MSLKTAVRSFLTYELTTAERLARRAGAEVMRFYGSTAAELKSCRSPVTEADRVANRLITAGLAQAFPGDAILSEETRDSPQRLGAERLWIVDPLDGTKEFLARNGEFSVMIGLAVEGRAVLGVVYAPATGVLYSAAAGLGTRVAQAGRRRLLFCRPPPGPALRLVGSRSHPEPLLRELQGVLGIGDVQPCGSVGLKCARIAEGERDLYLHPVPYLKEWDTCAPEVVLREAGGTVTDCLGEPLRYNQPEPVQPHGILACARGLLPEVLPEIRAVYAAAAA